MWQRRREALALCATLVVVLAGGGQAAAAGFKQQLDLTAAYLQSAQNTDGGFPGTKGGASDPESVSAWSALAFAAWGVNPRDVAQPGGTDVYTYLEHHAGVLSETTDFERTLLVTNATGADPHAFGGRDLVAELLSRRRPDGSFTHVDNGTSTGVNDTIFAILGLAPVHEPAVAAAVQRAADQVEALQNDDGSWPAFAPGSEGDADMTGAGIQALVAAGRASAPAVTQAMTYLRECQNADGGLGEACHAASNTASTSWAAQGFWAAGVDPETVTAGGPGLLDYLASMQQPDGEVLWTAGSPNQNTVWMTAYAGPAFGGRWLPIAAPPSAPKPPAAPAPSPPTAPPTGAPSAPADAGAGGTAQGTSAGVKTKAGGRGAPLFSRPQSASQGTTPDAPRQTDPTVVEDHAAPSSGAAAPSPARPKARPRPRTPRQIAAQVRRGGGQGAGQGREVSGTLIGDAPDTTASAAAPGLRAASAGGTTSRWTALAIAAGIALCALAGAALERRIPRLHL